MKKITQKQFDKAVDLHLKWLRSYGMKGKQADFSYVDFSGWEIEHVDLTGAKLAGARFDHCRIHCCSFMSTYLTYTSFRRAYIANSTFDGAVMDNTCFCNAYFYSVRLDNTDLEIYGLDGASGLPDLVCPEKGSFIGFKKACYLEAVGELGDLEEREFACIVELEILEDAMRSSAARRKCRCSKAKVLSITTLDGIPLDCTAFSSYDDSFKYRVGETVEVANFDKDRWNECAPGIHFFITRQEAVDYNL